MGYKAQNINEQKNDENNARNNMIQTYPTRTRSASERDRSTQGQSILQLAGGPLIALDQICPFSY